MLVYVEITEKRYQEAIRDRLIVEMISKIISESDYSYLLSEMARALLEASNSCREYEAEVEAYPPYELPFKPS